MLPAATEQVWGFLKEQPALSGFVLIGGSALALRIHHRLSEDLDLAFPGVQLPRASLNALLRVAAEAKIDFQRNDSEIALQEFLQGGLELHDYQQDFLVGGQVKVTFFSPDAAEAKILKEPAEVRVRIATLAELFKSKCLLSARRSKTRDWLDLYLLMREHGFSIHDFLAAFVEAGVSVQCDAGLSRLCCGTPPHDDEGYQHLLSSPPTLEEMTSFFIAQRDLLEVQRAAQAKGARSDGPG